MLEQGEDGSTVEQSTQIGATEIFEMSTILRFMLKKKQLNGCDTLHMLCWTQQEGRKTSKIKYKDKRMKVMN